MVKDILHLTLKKKYFDLIADGQKKIEYRDIKPYWTIRFIDNEGEIIKYKEIYFKNGYSKNSPFMRVKWNGLRLEKHNGIMYMHSIRRFKNT